MELEQVQPLVDGVDQTDLPRQAVQDANPAAAESAGAVGNLILDPGGGEPGPVATLQVGLVQAALEALLAAD